MDQPAPKRSRWTTPALLALLACAILIWWYVFGHDHYSNDKPYLAQMKWDLRNLVTAEESYFTDSASYARPAAAMHYTPTTGVTVTIGAADSAGWNATARHRSTSRTCGVFVGTAPTPIQGASEGEPKCT